MKLNGIEIMQSDFISMSGKKPSNQLLANNVLTISSKEIIPMNESILDPNSLSFDRYFNVIPGQHFDSESKLVEYIFEQIRITRQINIPNGASRSDLLPAIIQGITLDLNLISEMNPCLSCSDILDNLESILPNSVTLNGGTLYDNSHISD